MNKTLIWLLDDDPSIRWQTKRDLVNAREGEYQTIRKMIAFKGWGTRLLSKQDPAGTWAGGLYTPKWKSTTYTLLLLRRLGLQPKNPQALKGCALLINKGFYYDDGIAFSKTWGRGETCVTGMVLSILSYFHYQD